ncbi:hypothetical protein CDAR_67271 [Caerostris darwini]|uniref:Uncharacterized protein n=1 Tax=Caerostris darwini TaxID=1538125 RepID=A0AAV4NYS2_9ARAC|nr:hypothetical protein CDAR_67271 [Caerostris darwini]
MDKQNETFEEQFQHNYDKYKNQKVGVMKLQDAFTDYFQCLIELPESRKVALESIVSSLEPQWKDFPELQDQSGKSVRNIEVFCNTLLNHLGNNAQESVSSCEEDIAEKESIFEQIAKIKWDIELANAGGDTNKERVETCKDQLAELENFSLERKRQLKKKLSRLYSQDKQTFRKSVQVWFAEEESFHQEDYEILSKIEKILDGLPKKEESTELFSYTE